MSKALADRGDHETVLSGAVVDPQEGAVHGLVIDFSV
jgi:hypothetical protein